MGEHYTDCTIIKHGVLASGAHASAHIVRDNAMPAI